MKVNGLYNNQSLNNDIKAKRDIKPKKSSIHRFNGFLTSERFQTLFTEGVRSRTQKNIIYNHFIAIHDS